MRTTARTASGFSAAPRPKVRRILGVSVLSSDMTTSSCPPRLGVAADDFFEELKEPAESLDKIEQVESRRLNLPRNLKLELAGHSRFG